MKKLITLCLLFVIVACQGSAKDSKDIYAKDIAKQVAKGRAVDVVGKIVWGDIDFSTMGRQQMRTAGQVESVVGSNIVFVDCVFMGRVTTNGVLKVQGHDVAVMSRFEQNLVFVGCDFRGEVDFDNAVAEHNVDFGRSTFRENASFCGFVSKAAKASMAGIATEKQFKMIYATFGGDLSLGGANFGGRTSMQELRVWGSLWATDIKSQGVDLDMLEVRGSARFDNSEGIEKQ